MGLCLELLTTAFLESPVPGRLQEEGRGRHSSLGVCRSTVADFEIEDVDAGWQEEANDRCVISSFDVQFYEL